MENAEKLLKEFPVSYNRPRAADITDRNIFGNRSINYDAIISDFNRILRWQYLVQTKVAKAKAMLIPGPVHDSPARIPNPILGLSMPNYEFIRIQNDSLASASFMWIKEEYLLAGVGRSVCVCSSFC
jgi:hypothetical protein